MISISQTFNTHTQFEVSLKYSHTFQLLRSLWINYSKTYKALLYKNDLKPQKLKPKLRVALAGKVCQHTKLRQPNRSTFWGKLQVSSFTNCQVQPFHHSRFRQSKKRVLSLGFPHPKTPFKQKRRQQWHVSNLVCFKMITTVNPENDLECRQNDQMVFSFLNVWILKCFRPIISMGAVDFTARNLEFLGFQSRNCGQVATPNPRASKTSLKRSSREVNYSCAPNSRTSGNRVNSMSIVYIQMLYIVLTCESTIPDFQPSFF